MLVAATVGAGEDDDDFELASGVRLIDALLLVKIFGVFFEEATFSRQSVSCVSQFGEATELTILFEELFVLTKAADSEFRTKDDFSLRTLTAIVAAMPPVVSSIELTEFGGFFSLL